MGFRYAKVETDTDLTDAEFTAHAVYSEMPVTGRFACGNDEVDQLVKTASGARRATSAISHRLPDPRTRRLDGRYARVH